MFSSLGATTESSMLPIEIALVIFFLVFVGVVAWVLVTRSSRCAAQRVQVVPLQLSLCAD